MVDKETKKFRITLFLNDVMTSRCRFDIEGPELSREDFAAAHKALEDTLAVLNTGQDGSAHPIIAVARDVVARAKEDKYS